MAAALLYAIGWGRAFSFDASRTVAQFVTADAWGDVFRQDRFNNHPLFSFVAHLFHVVTGATGERGLRIVPILCGAAAVAVLAAAVARRFGALAGHVAGITFAVNALNLRQFREVRGYALVSLGAIVATLALFRLLRPPQARPAWLVLYGAALAAAVGTHLFAIGLIPLHAVVVLASRRFAAPLVVTWIGAAAVGVAVQWAALADGLSRPPRYIFAPTFPLRLALNLLGGPAAAGMLVLVIVGWTVLRSRPWVPWCAAAVAAMATAAWLAGPSWLDSRFFIWLVPAVAVAAGAGVARHPRLVALAIACVVVQLAVLGRDLTRDEVPNRVAAAYVRAGQQRGEAVCALGRTRAGLLAYVDDVRVVWDGPELAGCDIAVEAAGPKAQPLIAPACGRYAYVRVLDAKYPGAIFAERPLDGQGWVSTASAPRCRSGD